MCSIVNINRVPGYYSLGDGITVEVRRYGSGLWRTYYIDGEAVIESHVNGQSFCKTCVSRADSRRMSLCFAFASTAICDDGDEPLHEEAFPVAPG